MRTIFTFVISPIKLTGKRTENTHANLPYGIPFLHFRITNSLQKRFREGSSIILQDYKMIIIKRLLDKKIIRLQDENGLLPLRCGKLENNVVSLESSINQVE